MKEVGFEQEDEDTSSIRLHQLLMAAAFIVPALLFVGAAWKNHADVLRETQDTVDRTAAVMQEHARKVFETAELAIGVVDERTAGESWSEIASPGTSEFLRRLKGPMDQLVSIWIADGHGVMRAGSQPWPPGSGIAERGFFRAQQDADRGTYIGEPFTGLATGKASFAIIRRRTTSDGEFDGTIHVAASPEYFSRFYAEISPPFAHNALLLRDDGAILAREPPHPGAPTQISVTSPILARIKHWSGANELVYDAASDGVGYDTAIRQVGDYPVFVTFSVPRTVVFHRWLSNLRLYGLVAGAAALTLLVVAFMALRRAQAEQEVLQLLRAENRQRLAAEQQLRHVQRMDAVGQLTGGVAHDFNNLLTAILGNLELIQRSVWTPDGQNKVAHLTTTAIKAVHRGAALTKSLLAFSRKQPLHARAVDANRQLGDFMELLRQAVGVTVTVEFVPEPDLPPCFADPAELEAALLNLAINARDAMPNGGHLLITTRTATLDPKALAANPEAYPGEYVAIDVADTGTGMTDEIASKAFEPFFTTKPPGQGTGLGLSQVFGFVRQLGGHVTIGRTARHATVITLFLPVVLETAETP